MAGAGPFEHAGRPTRVAAAAALNAHECGKATNLKVMPEIPLSFLSRALCRAKLWSNIAPQLNQSIRCVCCQSEAC